MKKKVTCRQALENVLRRRKTPATLEQLQSNQKLLNWSDETIRRTLYSMARDGDIVTQGNRPQKFAQRRHLSLV